MKKGRRVISGLFFALEVCKRNMMRKSYTLAIVLLLTVLPTVLFARSTDELKYVLRKNKIGKEYRWDRSNPNEANILRLVYLGQVRSRSGSSYKLMTSIWEWGHSHRATTRLLIFDGENKYLGNYYLGPTEYAPNMIKDGRLVFANEPLSGCDEKVRTLVSFRNGIPTQLFRECRNGEGDSFLFSSE
jgi:hypothetical protein